MSEQNESGMMDLYTMDMLSALNRQLKRRWLVLGAAAAVLLAVFVWSLASRGDAQKETELQVISTAALVLLGFFAVFWIDLFCMPLLRYRNLVRSALVNRNVTKSMEFVRTEPDLSMVDGVSCRSLIFLGDPDKHGAREQLLYWDENIPLPGLIPGKEYTVRYTDRTIVAVSQPV